MKKRTVPQAKGALSQVGGTSTAASTIPLTSAGSTFGSLDIFECCIERARNLLKIHKAAHGKKAKPEKYLADAHRAAIVLSIAALDAFVRSFVITRIRAILANKTTTIPPALVDRIKSFLKEDALLEAARKDDLLDRVEKAFREDFEKKSFQGTKQITDSLRLVGFDDIFHEVAISAKENEDNLRQKLDKHTQRRHVVAHRGDYDLSKNPPEEHTITKSDAEDCIKVVTCVATHINKLGQT